MRAAPSVPWGRRRRAEPCGWHARAGAGEMVRFCPPSIAPVLGWFLAVSRRPRVSCASLRVQHSMSVCRVRSVDRTTRRSHPFSWEFAPGGAAPCIVMQYVRIINRQKSDPGTGFPGLAACFVGNRRRKARLTEQVPESEDSGKNLLSNKEDGTPNGPVLPSYLSAYQSETPGSGPGDSWSDPGPILSNSSYVLLKPLRFN